MKLTGRCAPGSGGTNPPSSTTYTPGRSGPDRVTEGVAETARRVCTVVTARSRHIRAWVPSATSDRMLALFRSCDLARAARSSRSASPDRSDGADHSPVQTAGAVVGRGPHPPDGTWDEPEGRLRQKVQQEREKRAHPRDERHRYAEDEQQERWDTEHQPVPSAVQAAGPGASGIAAHPLPAPDDRWLDQGELAGGTPDQAPVTGSPVKQQPQRRVRPVDAGPGRADRVPDLLPARRRANRTSCLPARLQAG